MIGCVVLAAGGSTRMPERNKLTADVNGKPMVNHVIDAALEAGAHPVVVVVAADDREVATLVSDRPVIVVENERAAAGMSTSLIKGIEAVAADRPPASGALVCLGDMPRVKSSTLRRLMDALPPRHEVRPIVPVHKGQRGNPVLWPAARFESIRNLEGDVGAKQLLERIAPLEVEVDDAGVLVDVDDNAGLEQVRGMKPVDGRTVGLGGP